MKMFHKLQAFIHNAVDAVGINIEQTNAFIRESAPINVSLYEYMLYQRYIHQSS